MFLIIDGCLKDRHFILGIGLLENMLQVISINVSKAQAYIEMWSFKISFA